jgi:flagellar basal-body rod modification protein FlgD
MIDPLNNLGLGNLTLGSANDTDRSELGQEAFLELMTTQLKNQDPFKPLESGEFLGQLAQFGTVAGLSQLNDSFAQVATSLSSNQALQASNLVGRTVLVESSLGYLPPGGRLSGALEVDGPATGVRIQVLNATGELVRSIDLGGQSGTVNFVWGGETDSGEIAGPGTYVIQAQAISGSGERALPTLMNAFVDSVAVGPLGLNLNLRGIGDVSFDAVREIG